MPRFSLGNFSPLGQISPEPWGASSGPLKKERSPTIVCHCFAEAVLFAEKHRQHCFCEAVAHLFQQAARVARLLEIDEIVTPNARWHVACYKNVRCEVT